MVGTITGVAGAETGAEITAGNNAETIQGGAGVQSAATGVVSPSAAGGNSASVTASNGGSSSETTTSDGNVVDNGANSDTSTSGNADSGAAGTQNGAASDKATTGSTGDAAQQPAAEADDVATAFVNALQSDCDAGTTERVITVTTDITVTTTGIKPKCNITLVSDGKDHTIIWGGKGSVLQPQNGKTFTIGRVGDDAANKLTFTNKGASTNPLFHNYGTLTINGGTFKDSTSARGTIVFNDGTLTITGGTFTDNKSLDAGDASGGAVLYQQSGSTTITGGTFTNNAQTFTAQCADASGVPTPDGRKDADGHPTSNPCRRQNSGGGAIHTEGGSLIIQGNVLFKGNYSKAYGWGDGGGAIFAKGELRVQNDAKGNKPQFIGNWSGITDQQFVDGKVPVGGAVGAIFLQGGSTGYFMGGKFTDNSSGYLGGGIYTEDNTTSWVSKAVATDNTAGHFGGGLWLCPSGFGDASKGGNIALFDNSVNKDIDVNTLNYTPFVGTTENQTDGKGGTVTYAADQVDGVEAGADLAMMNPAWKNLDKNRTFVLMDTWFTDRTQSAVDWYEDGTPVREASGFADWYQSVKNDWVIDGSNLAVTKTNGRYVTKATNGAITTKIHVDLGVDDETDHDAHSRTLELSKDAASSPIYTTGVALTSVVRGTEAEQAKAKADAMDSAVLVMTGNKARLSGGAFGTNGNVKFSTPYTASWSKVDANDPNKLLSGSEWELTTTSGGPYSPEFYPTYCTAGEDWNAGTCWKKTVNGNVTSVSAIIKDNTGSGAYVGFDNNPNGGEFDINNLANGTYTLTEIKAPTGYEAIAGKTYTFTVNDHQATWDNGSEVDKHIGNTPLAGVSWNKQDADTGKPVAGSGWTITKLDVKGNEIADTARTVTDCADTDTVTCAKGTNDETAKTYADLDGTAGQIRVEGLAAGAYKLVETTVPNGYWRPSSGMYYTFTIAAGSTGNDTVDLYRHDSTTSKPVKVENKTITNTQPQASWSKIAAGNNDKLLEGSAWQLRGPLTVDGKEIAGKTVTAAVTDCRNEAGATDPCASHTNTVGADGKITAYADVDKTAGQFTVLGLAVPPAGTQYRYELTETAAPDGYVLSDVTYSFTIPTSVPTKVQIDAPKSATAALAVRHDDGKNLIPNVPAVASLPMTGGTGRMWLIVGGAVGVVAAIAWALVNEYRKRKGLAA
ncbi:SpaA isopeptide-forming pilin-related protein [Bifidobacterium leontopitheci]|uniref:SpaA-like prealbumin fold domain-containing protein n=1 Tax=Bifidobacterium leontopitheci TaxID=2650774 RepID=A0A6I1GE47_9BIFI|nr:SpaA isopeptide-forming pilin-related protein [Bifidobacterium leontopitheci]KAB7789904.1 hypothetical protein F7D09_1571 [Bifidobacterium leontopitheci]